MEKCYEGKQQFSMKIIKEPRHEKTCLQEFPTDAQADLRLCCSHMT